jgi:hypothetical protein
MWFLEKYEHRGEDKIHAKGVLKEGDYYFQSYYDDTVWMAGVTQAPRRITRSSSTQAKVRNRLKMSFALLTQIMKDAFYYEISKGGQIYPFIHSRKDRSSPRRPGRKCGGSEEFPNKLAASAGRRGRFRLLVCYIQLYFMLCYSTFYIAFAMLMPRILAE